MKAPCTFSRSATSALLSFLPAPGSVGVNRLPSSSPQTRDLNEILYPPPQNAYLPASSPSLCLCKKATTSTRSLIPSYPRPQVSKHLPHRRGSKAPSANSLTLHYPSKAIAIFLLFAESFHIPFFLPPPASGLIISLAFKERPREQPERVRASAVHCQTSILIRYR